MSGTTAFVLLVIVTVAMLAPAIYFLNRAKQRKESGEPFLSLRIVGFVLIGILATGWTVMLAALIYTQYSFVLTLLMFLLPFIIIIALILLPILGIYLVVKGAEEKARTGVRVTSFSFGIGLLIAFGVLLTAIILLFVYFSFHPISLM